MSGAGNVSARIADNTDIALYNAFKEIVSGSKVQDGDLRINGDKLEKINFGSGLRRTFSKASDLCNQTIADSSDIKQKFIRAFTARLDAIEGLDEAKKQDLIARLTVIVGDKPGTPLSRRTVSLIVQMVEDKGDFAGRERAKTYDGVTWKMVGGPRGMRMSQKQFETMFESAMDLAVKKNAKYKLGLEAALKYYKDQFANTQNGADLERYFTGSLDLETISDKMIAHLEEGLVPSMKGKTRNLAMCPGVLSEVMCRKLAAVKDAEMLHGTAAINRKVNIDALIQRKHKQDAEVGPAKNFASEILLGTDMHELAFTGLDDGERLGRFFLKNAPVFQRICNSVVEREAVLAANRKNPKAPKPVPQECDEIRSLRLASPELADDFTKLISQLAKSVLSLKPGMKPEDFKVRLVEKADQLYKAISDFKITVGKDTVKGFEKIIDRRLSDRMFVETDGPKNPDERSSLADRFYEALCKYFGEGTETGAAMIKLLVQNAPPTTLRRMFALGVRENGCKDLSKPEEEFFYAGMIRGLGPLATKIFQGMNLDEDDQNDQYGIYKALMSACGDNPDINPEIVRAIIYDTLQSKNIDFDSVQITCAAGAGSVAQTMMCKVYSGDEAPAVEGQNGNQEKDIIIKVFRPGIKEEFDAEAQAIREALVDENDETIRQIEDGLIPFENSIASEVNPKSELINALKGLRTYGQPSEKGKDIVPVKRQWNLDNGKTVESESTISVGSERLVLKKGIKLDEPLEEGGKPVREQLMDDLDACKTDEDFGAVLEKYFVCDNDATMLIETAAGRDISKAIDDFVDRYNRTKIALPKNEQGDTIFPLPDDPKIQEALKNRDGLVKLSRSFAVLTEKFVNGALFAKNPFVHGDLQAGNIRYDDSTGEIVMIDYGKAMTLKQGESDALKILFQLEGRKETPKDADLALEAYLSLVDDEIARLEKDGTDPARLAEMKNTKTVLATKKGKEVFRLACKGSDGVHNTKDGNVFKALVGILQKRKLPVPKALVMFNDSYSRLRATADRIGSTLKGYDKLLDQSMLKAATGMGIETDLESLSGLGDSGANVNNPLPLDYIGSVNCKVTFDEDSKKSTITVEEAEIPGNYSENIGKGSHSSASAILYKLNETIFGNGKTLHERRQAAKEAITLLKHEQERLKTFQKQFCGEGELVETLKKYGIKAGAAEGEGVDTVIKVKDFGKCSAALQKIGQVIGNLQDFVKQIDESGFDYDDGAFQSTILGDKDTKKRVEDKFGGNASDWRLPKPTATEVDYVLAQYAKSVKPNSLMDAPEPIRKRFKELVVQSGLSWPKQLYLLSSKSLSPTAFELLVDKLSTHRKFDQEELDRLLGTGKYSSSLDKKIGLGFDENAELEGVKNEDVAAAVDTEDYNELVELAKDLGVTLPKSIDKKAKTDSVKYAEYTDLLTLVIDGEIPSPNRVLKCVYSGSEEYKEAKQTLHAVETMTFANRQCGIQSLPKGIRLRDEYEEVEKNNFGALHENEIPFNDDYSAEKFCMVVYSRKQDVVIEVNGLIEKYDKELKPEYDKATCGKSEFTVKKSKEAGEPPKCDVHRHYVDYLYALKDAAKRYYGEKNIPKDITGAIEKYEAYRDRMFSGLLNWEGNKNTVPLVSAKDCGFTDGTKNARDVYDETLVKVNSTMPEGLKLIHPGDGVTYADLDNLMRYTIPLEEDDKKEFDRMLNKLEDATPDYKARVDAYREKGKNGSITQGDFMRLAADLGRAFSTASLASDAVTERYNKVRDFIEKKLPFDPPPLPQGQITLVGYSDLLATMRRHALVALIKVPSGTKMNVVGEESRKEKKSHEQVTIGECKRAYDRFFKPEMVEGKEDVNRLETLRKEPEGGFFPIDGTQTVEVGDLELQALVKAAKDHGLPTPDLGTRKSVSIDEVKALYQEVRRLEETQPVLNDVSGIAANLFRGNRPAPEPGEKPPVWDLTQRQDDANTSVHYKTYAPVKFSELKFAGDSGFNLWSEGLGGRIKSGAKESYIAYEIGLVKESVDESPELNDRKERQRQEVIDRNLEYFRRSHADYRLNEVENDKDFDVKYTQEVRKQLQSWAKVARNKLFELDRNNNYKHGDKVFEALRKRINGNPDAFKIPDFIQDKPDTLIFDEKNANHIMLLEASLLMEEEDR